MHHPSIKKSLDQPSGNYTFHQNRKKIVKLSDDSFKESILFSCLKKGERIIIIQQHQCEITCNAFTIHIEIEMNSKE